LLCIEFFFGYKLPYENDVKSREDRASQSNVRKENNAEYVIITYSVRVG
jgi:hypothetical protein